ncbi:type VII secretion integral membrane protein EccD [Solwaraspora sp. WMMD406]|uniref:type VII secretion integral membrane protein EccD n=1 Tax=Solwaraspora sp. WMMD406 TaxID=3016095 RepID=UPI0024172FF8|nr:type VII secretion integral membrane protein EccD [Solwaraspora sp. WMMD406]MDG4768476.1 type VII secretion integral membrane protein EccD [Solwaraspora sp. WMMD406]
MSVPLARVTIRGPRRRLDLALPEHVPVAELLPEMLRHAGDGLADEGERHGGWVLCRADGSRLVVTRPLRQQGVRDGEVLHLVPGWDQWPEPEYDDVVESIADAARRHTRVWSASVTRVCALAVAGLFLGVAWLVLLRNGFAQASSTALAIAAGLTAAGVLAARAYGDRSVGVVLGGYALPYFFAAGVLHGGSGRTGSSGDLIGPTDLLGPTSTQVLAGSVLLLIGGLSSIVGIAAGLPVFAAAVTVAVLGGIAATVSATVTDSVGAATLLLVVVVCGIGLLPLLAVKLGRVPVPGVSPAVSPHVDERATTGFAVVSDDVGPDPVVGRSGRGSADELAVRERSVLRSVSRAEELLTGMLAGYAVSAVGASVVLVSAGGSAGRVLVGVGAVALLLRSRTFVAVRQRLPLITCGVLGVVVLGVGVLAPAGPEAVRSLALAAGVLALAVVAAGGRYATRPPSPYLSRTADVLETGLVVSVVPVAGAVLGLYSWASGLLG